MRKVAPRADRPVFIAPQGHFPMLRLAFVAACGVAFGACGVAACGVASAQPPTSLKDRTTEIESQVTAELPSLETLYKQLHSHPELSLQEEQTAARLTKGLKNLGFDVTTTVGGHGIVGTLRNGDGPTVMIRTDMDGLPVMEKTGLPYASTVRLRDKNGREVGAMHACGHDMHIDRKST